LPIRPPGASQIHMPATVWKGYLSFGLVSFPIRLFAAARPEAVHFHLLHQKDLSRIKEVWYCAEEDKPVDDIVKGFEVSKGEYVVIDDSELKSMAPATAKVMEILQFVRAGEVDPILLEKSYYVGAEEAGSKPYALLLAAMNETKYYAVAKLSMHAREHVVIIRPTRAGMVLHTMYFANELHKANKAGSPAKGQVSEKELAVAKRLVETLASPFKPEQYRDEYRKNVERLIEQKQKGQRIAAVKQPKLAPVVDMFEALKRSLEQSAKTGTAKGSRKAGKSSVGATRQAKRAAARAS
jgi:DNA end-binding protein Ku